MKKTKEKNKETGCKHSDDSCCSASHETGIPDDRTYIFWITQYPGRSRFSAATNISTVYSDSV